MATLVFVSSMREWQFSSTLRRRYHYNTTKSKKESFVFMSSEESEKAYLQFYDSKFIHQKSTGGGGRL